MAGRTGTIYGSQGQHDIGREHDAYLAQSFAEDSSATEPNGRNPRRLPRHVARGRGGASGVEFLERLRAAFRHVIIYATPDLVADATQHWLRRFRDHPLTLTDAVSFEVMRREGIDAAFAVDRHFAIAGSELVGDDSSVVTRTRRRQKK